MKDSSEIAVVTGGAGGIGAAVARRLAAGGMRVVAIDRHLEGLKDGPESITGIACDVRDEAAIDAAFAKAERLGPVSVAITCAGQTLGCDFLEMSQQAFRDLIEVNLTGSFLACRAAARLMAQRRRGAIVTIASVTGLRATSGRSAYAASKSAVMGLTRGMAIDLARHGIRVNCVAPGAVETPLAAKHHAGVSAAIPALWRRATPMARYGCAEEIAAAACWLASDEASFVTGETMMVDGGFNAAGMIFDSTAGAADVS